MSDESRQKYHAKFVNELVHKHPEDYPKVRPVSGPPFNEEEVEKEVQDFDKIYQVPKEGSDVSSA